MSHTIQKGRTKAPRFTPAQKAARDRNRAAVAQRSTDAPLFMDRELAQVISALDLENQTSFVRSQLSDFSINSGADISEVVGYIDIRSGVSPIQEVISRSISCCALPNDLELCMVNVANNFPSNVKLMAFYTSSQVFLLKGLVNGLLRDGLIVCIQRSNGLNHYLKPAGLFTDDREKAWQRKIAKRLAPFVM